MPILPISDPQLVLFCPTVNWPPLGHNPLATAMGQLCRDCAAAAAGPTVPIFSRWLCWAKMVGRMPRNNRRKCLGEKAREGNGGKSIHSVIVWPSKKESMKKMNDGNPMREGID